MLTSPVNVTTALNGAPLKPHSAPSDPGARKEPLAPLAGPTASVAEMVIEPELPSNSPMTSVNAFAATAGNRTILQELSLNIAMMLKVARRQDESLTALFIRIIAAIEAMPQGERLQLEARSGLKGLKITLADLAAALRNPDGPGAARLTATAEAPLAVPGRAAASSATSTYLQEGTADGHAEETLAMRAAARHSGAGQSVFTAENKVRPADAQPVDAKVLQNQLKTMFEAGESGDVAVRGNLAPPDVADAVPDVEAAVEDSGHADAEVKPEAPDDIAAGHHPTTESAAEKVSISSSNLRLDPQALAKIRTAAQAIADSAPEMARSTGEQPPAEKAEPDEPRPQTLLTFKGIVEAVTALPAKAAELLATTHVEAELPTPEKATGDGLAAVSAAQGDLEEEGLPELATAPDEVPAGQLDEVDAAAEAFTETPTDDDMTLPTRPEMQAGTEKARSPGAEPPAPARPDLTQHAVPFGYVQVQPARDEMTPPVEEEEPQGENEEHAGEDSEDNGEKRRPRDEYDAIHDPLPDDEPALVINRDSSESDRAFALYQRMGGF